MSQGSVQWSEVDYGGEAFHVASYKRPEPAAKAAPQQAAASPRCMTLEALLRCWSSYAACGETR